MSLLIISVMLYIKFSILVPFEQMVDVPYELSKGNLTVPVKETKTAFSGVLSGAWICSAKIWSIRKAGA